MSYLPTIVTVTARHLANRVGIPLLEQIGRGFDMRLHDWDHPVDGADQLAEAEAHQEVFEPYMFEKLQRDIDNLCYPKTPAVVEQPAPAGNGPAAVDTPHPAAGPLTNDWVDWITPAIKEVLANHKTIRDCEGVYCEDIDGAPHGDFADHYEWRNHIAPILAAHIAAATKSYSPK